MVHWAALLGGEREVSELVLEEDSGTLLSSSSIFAFWLCYGSVPATAVETYQRPKVTIDLALGRNHAELSMSQTKQTLAFMSSLSWVFHYSEVKPTHPFYSWGN